MLWINLFPAKFFKVDLEETKDGLEGINRLFIAIAILTIALGCPGMLFAINYNLPVFRFFNFHHIGLNVLLVLFIMANLCLDWTFVVTLVLTILIHANCNSRWTLRSRQAW